MERKFFLLLFVSLSFAYPQERKADQKSIPAFEIMSNDLELSRPAQPTQYFDKIGRRTGLMGYESGTFEAWVWPWKPLRNFELSFLLGASTEPILAKDIVRTISVTPEVTTLIYTYESFTVKEYILVPRDEPGAILLLDVHSTTPLSIIPGFIPVMQPMWPAGIGGQFSYWDDDVNGYVISEGQWRAEFICGSPGGQQMAAPPAHMFADNPLQFKIDVKPGESDGRFIPIVIAGAVPDSASGKMKMDSVKATYTRLWKNAEKYYRENYDYYRDLRYSTMQVTTPDKLVNLAYEWGKVALDNLLITNPKLGTGLVAGFGLSGGGERPGFAWFFGGDAFINVLTMNSVGMFKQSRDALAFTQKWQRQDDFPIRKKNPGDPPKDVGKMAHELSQSDGICDWWNDYHYGYNHADTTPWYLVAMGDYVRTSGDVEFLKQSWTFVKQAYAWCLSKDSDADGLMDLKGAGLGALEFGKLVGIYADVYTCGVWVQSIKEMKYMAELVGDTAAANQADAQFRKAQPQLEKKFWMDKEGYYSYGATEKGEQVHEKTPWSGVAMMFGLLDEDRTAKSIEEFNGADLCTDWGVRTLSNKSDLFDPTNYNYGAVWPFIASFFNTAQFKHHYALAGYQILQSNIRHVFDHGLGVVPEVFSGELNEKLGEGYHHQGFSTTGYMLPLVRGFLGLEVDALRKTIHFSPPGPWVPYLRIGNVKMNNDTINLQTYDAAVQVRKNGLDSIAVAFSPSLNLCSEVEYVSLNSSSGKMADSTQARIPFSAKNGIEDNHVLVNFKVWDQAFVNINLLPGLRTVRFPHFATQSYYPISDGSTNKGLRFISEKLQDGKLVLTVEGLSGVTYDIALDQFNRVVSGAEPKDKDHRMHTVTFDKKTKQEFVRKEIVITVK